MVRVTSTSTFTSSSGAVQMHSRMHVALWKVCEGFCSGMALRRAPAEMHVDAIDAIHTCEELLRKVSSSSVLHHVPKSEVRG